MGNRIFQVVVLLMWLCCMSWLLVAKILPPFFQGEPPQAGAAERTKPVAWAIEFQGQRCGVSVSQATPGTLDTMELHSRVRLNSLPLPRVAPQWMQSLLRNFGDVQLDLRNRATFDSLGALSNFRTTVDLNEVDAVVKMTGRVRDGSVHLRVQTGEYTRESKHLWRENSLLGGQLSPEPKLLNVYVGRKWREEVYSPFSAPGSPAELVEAEVEGEETLLIEGRSTRVKRIAYRSLSAAGVSAKDRVRSVVWVREDGVVVRQDSCFMNTRLRFDRLPQSEADRLSDEMLELGRYSALGSPQLKNRAAEPADAADGHDKGAEHRAAPAR